jgi:hypothetical protein
LAALKNEIPAKSEVKGNLDTYKYYDNVSASSCNNSFEAAAAAAAAHKQ